MLMHFPVYPVMSVFSGVRVGSHRNECLLLMWEFRLWCMSKTRTTSKGPVGDRCVTVNLEPTRTSNFLRKQQEADSDLKVFNRWKEDGDKKKTIVGRCVASELCYEDLVVTVGLVARCYFCGY